MKWNKLLVALTVLLVAGLGMGCDSTGPTAPPCPALYDNLHPDSRVPLEQVPQSPPECTPGDGLDVQTLG